MQRELGMLQLIWALFLCSFCLIGEKIKNYFSKLLCRIEMDGWFTFTTCLEPEPSFSPEAGLQLFVDFSPWHICVFLFNTPSCCFSGRSEVTFWLKATCHLFATQDSSFIHKHNPTCNQIHPPCIVFATASVVNILFCLPLSEGTVCTSREKLFWCFQI